MQNFILAQEFTDINTAQKIIAATQIQSPRIGDRADA